MNDQVKPVPRTRMRPEERRDSILAHAAKLVMSEGVTAVTIDRVRQAANISRSLIYNYFKDTTELLVSLLQKERQLYRQHQEDAVSKARNFEEIIRLTVRTTLKYYLDNGELIVRLTNEPVIANAVLESEEELEWRANVESYFAKQIMDRYNLDEDIAAMAFEIVEGLAESAGLRSLRRLGAESLDFIEEITVTANMAALATIGRRYSSHPPSPAIDEQWLADAQSMISTLSGMIKKERD